MTAWQDQPPQTRRQVRMNERGSDVDAAFGSSGEALLPESFVADSVAADTVPAEPDFAAPATTDAAPSSRRAQRAAETAQFTSLEAEQRAWRERDFRPRASPADTVWPNNAEPARVEQLRFDASQVSAPVAAPVADAVVEPATLIEPEVLIEAVVVEPLTLVQPFVPNEPPALVEPPELIQPQVWAESVLPAELSAVIVDAIAVVEQPAAPAEVTEAAPARHLTRRELRALEEERARLEEDSAVAESVEEDLVSEQPIPVPSVPEQTSPELELSVQPVVVLPVVEEPVAWVAQDFGLLPSALPVSPPVSSPVAEQLPVEIAPEEPIAFVAPVFDFAPPVGAPVLPEMPAPTGPGYQVPDFDALALAGDGSLSDLAALPDMAMPADRGVDLAPQVFTAPVGHWTTQEALDDATQHELVRDELSLELNPAPPSGPITTSALVIPTVPQASNIIAPFGSTGEVLITGTINLPPSMGTTGAHPARYDHSDIDAMIDAADRDLVEGDSAPVRAIRAVSTHTSPRDVIMAKRPSDGNRLPMALAITAGAMMVSVAVLAVVGLVFNIF